MENEQKNKKYGAFADFFDRNYHILITIFALVSLLCLTNPFLKITYKIDGIKSYEDINVFYFFSHVNSSSWTMYLTIGLILLSILFIWLSKKISELEVASALLLLVSVIMVISSREILSDTGIANVHSVEFQGYVNGCVLCLAIAITFAFLKANTNSGFTVSAISEDGVLIAAAFVLNFIKIDFIPGAGSFNLQMLPLFIIALRRGVLHSFLCSGVVYGLLSCITDGYGINCYPYDYLIAFGGTAVLSFFRHIILDSKVKTYNFKGELFIFIGCMIATLIRMIGSTLSSMIIWELGFAEAVAYNLTYVPISGIGAMLILMIGYGFVIRFNKQFPIERRITD